MARKRIALLVGQPEESYQESFIRGFLGQAFSDDYDVCVFAMYQKHQITRVREQGEADIFSLIGFDMFEAIVVMANTIQTQGLLEYLEEELHERYEKPVIFVDKESRYFRSVSADNHLLVKQVISHLIEEHGYTDIAFLTGNEFHHHAKLRLQGFLECMEEHGLEVPEDRVFYGDFWYNSGAATAARLLRDKEHLPQVVACANDPMAIGLIGELEREGIRVPEDIAVTGYDASPEGRRYRVPITSLALPAQACGAYTAKCVKAACEGEEIEDFSAPAELYIGESCGCKAKEDAALEKNFRESGETTDQFDFNASTMEDDMLMQTELSGMMNTVFSYVYQIRPFESFHLCLNADFVNGNPREWERMSYTSYSENMVDALRCNAPGKGVDRVDLTTEFDREELLPELSEEREAPRAYYFTPLFFEEHCFGYVAVNYGETIRCYDAAYKKWLSQVIHGLECFLRIHALQMENERLEINQIRDELTGLYNYRGFLKAAAALGEMAGEDGFADITVIELCGVNEISANIGDQRGNRIIVDFSQMLFSITGKELRGYLGSGEFLAARITCGEAEDDTEAIAEQLRGQLADYSRNNGLEGKLGLAFGRTQGRADNEEVLGNLVSEAVSRKNADKIKGQRQKQSDRMEAEGRNGKIVADILDHNRLTYHFQPIVDAGTGEIFAYEALMRADTEEHISPLDILKCAENLGRLGDVEKATFLNVLAFVEENPELFEGKKVFINSIPGTQMAEADSELIREKLKDFSGKIVVELTEQAEMDDEQLDALKQKYEKLGVDTAVDDYGTGYSNVYNLLRYMPNVVKIDRMLLANIQLSAQKQHFVKEIIEFAHNNKITVLAEGVETQEELKMVTALGTDLIQGYYTAKPNAEVIPKIDHKVRNEIVQYGQYALEKSKRKVYHAGQDGNITLMKLATGHYAKILFTQENVPHRDVSVAGLQGFSANVEIETEDHYTGRIELKDVDLAVHNEQPAIRLGEHCDVTLVLRGENILEQGGILVPESSKLTIQGDGNLRIRQIAVNGYGIGNDKDSRCGELYFEQDGLIEIGGNTLHGVGIGAGCGGRIHINRGMYSIGLAGEEAVGIGALYADADLKIQYCAIDFDMKNSVNVGIGSIRGNVTVDVSCATLRGLFSAKRCVCIGTLDEGSFRFHLADGIVDFTARAGNMCGIGSLAGDAEVSAERFSVKISAEGKEAIAMGNMDKTAKIHTHNGDLIIQVKNQMDCDVGAETFEMINGHSTFILNGQEIVREAIEGDM